MSEPSPSDTSHTPVAQNKTLARWITKKEDGIVVNEATHSLAGTVPPKSTTTTTTTHDGEKSSLNHSVSDSPNIPHSSLPVISPSTTSTITDDDRSRMSTTDDVINRIDMTITEPRPTTNAVSFPVDKQTTNNLSSTKSTASTVDASSASIVNPPKEEKSTKKRTKTSSSSSSSSSTTPSTSLPQPTTGTATVSPTTENNNATEASASATATTTPVTVNKSKKATVLSTASKNFMASFLGRPPSNTNTTPPPNQSSSSSSSASSLSIAHEVSSVSIPVAPISSSTTSAVSSQSEESSAASHNTETLPIVSHFPTDTSISLPSSSVVPLNENIDVPVNGTNHTATVISDITTAIPPEQALSSVIRQHSKKEMTDILLTPRPSEATLDNNGNNHGNDDHIMNNDNDAQLTSAISLPKAADTSIIEIFDSPNNKDSRVPSVSSKESQPVRRAKTSSPLKFFKSANDSTVASPEVSLIRNTSSTTMMAIPSSISSSSSAVGGWDRNGEVPYHKKEYVPTALSTMNSFGLSFSLSIPPKQWNTLNYPTHGTNHPAESSLPSQPFDDTFVAVDSPSSCASSTVSSASLIPNFTKLLDHVRSSSLPSSSSSAASTIPVKVTVRPLPLSRQSLHRVINTPSYNAMVEFLYHKYSSNGETRMQRLNESFATLYSDNTVPVSSPFSSRVPEMSNSSSSPSVSVSSTPLVKALSSSSSTSSTLSTPSTPLVTTASSTHDRTTVQSIHQSLHTLFLRSVCDDTGTSLSSSHPGTLPNPHPVCSVASSLDGLTFPLASQSNASSTFNPNANTFDAWWPYKYRPLHSSQVCGNEASVRTLCTWLAEFRSALALPEDEYAKLLEALHKKQLAANQKQDSHSSSASELDEGITNSGDDSDDFFSDERDDDDDFIDDDSDGSFNIGTTKKRHRGKAGKKSKGKKGRKGKHGHRSRSDSMDPHNTGGTNRGIGEALASLDTLAILVGPTGSGKTAAVYACAAQLGYGVIEVNPDTERSKEYIMKQLREATQSRRMKMGNTNNAPAQHSSSSATTKGTGGITKPPTNTLSSMFNAEAVKAFAITKKDTNDTVVAKSTAETVPSKSLLTSESENELPGGKGEGKPEVRKKKSKKESKGDKDDLDVAPPPPPPRPNALLTMLGKSSGSITNSSSTVPSKTDAASSTTTKSSVVPTSTSTQSSITSLFKSAAKPKGESSSPLTILPVPETLDEAVSVPAMTASSSSSSSTSSVPNPADNEENSLGIVQVAGSFLRSIDTLKSVVETLPISSTTLAVPDASSSSTMIDLSIDVSSSSSSSTQSGSQLFSPSRSLSTSSNHSISTDNTTAAVSLILFEAGDFEYYKDINFLAAVRELAAETRCPIIITMNTLPLSSIHHQLAGAVGKRLLFYRPLPSTLGLYLSMVTIAEGNFSLLPYIENIVIASGCDIRYSLALLQLWYNRLPVNMIDQMDPDINRTIVKHKESLETVIQQARQIEDGTWQWTAAVKDNSVTLPTSSLSGSRIIHGESTEVDLLTPRITHSTGPSDTNHPPLIEPSPILLNLVSPENKKSKTTDKTLLVRSSPTKRSSTSMETGTKDETTVTVTDNVSSSSTLTTATTTTTGRPRRQAASNAITRLQEQAAEIEYETPVPEYNDEGKKDTAKENKHDEGSHQPSKRKRTAAVQQKDTEKSTDTKGKNANVVDLTSIVSPAVASKQRKLTTAASTAKSSSSVSSSSVTNSYSMILRHSTVIEAEKVAQSLVQNLRTGAYIPTVFVLYPVTVPVFPSTPLPFTADARTNYRIPEFFRSPSLFKPLDSIERSKQISKPIMVFSIESDVVFMSDLLPNENSTHDNGSSSSSAALTTTDTASSSSPSLESTYATFVIRGSGFRPNRTPSRSSSATDDSVVITIAGVPLPSSWYKIKSNGVLLLRLPVSWLYSLFDNVVTNSRVSPYQEMNPYSTLHESYCTYLLAPRKPKDGIEALMHSLSAEGIPKQPTRYEGNLVPILLTDLGITINHHEVYCDRRLMFVQASYKEMSGSQDLFHTLGSLLVKLMRSKNDGRSGGTKGAPDRSETKHKTKKSKFTMEPITTVVGVGIKRLRKVGGNDNLNNDDEMNGTETVHDIDELSTPKATTDSTDNPNHSTTTEHPLVPTGGKTYPDIIAGTDDGDDDDIIVQKRRSKGVPAIDPDEGGNDMFMTDNKVPPSITPTAIVDEDDDAFITTTDADNEIEKEEPYTLAKVPDPWYDISTDNEDGDNEPSTDKLRDNKDTDDDMNIIPPLTLPAVSITTESSTDPSSLSFDLTDLHYLCRYLDTLSTVDILSVPHGCTVSSPTISQGTVAPTLPILSACTPYAKIPDLYKEADMWRTLVLHHPDNIGRLQTEWNGGTNALYNPPSYLPYDIFTDTFGPTSTNTMDSDDTIVRMDQHLSKLSYDILYHNYGQSRNSLNYYDGELEEFKDDENNNNNNPYGSNGGYGDEPSSSSGRQTPSAGILSNGNDVRSQSLLTAFVISKPNTPKTGHQKDKTVAPVLIGTSEDELALPLPVDSSLNIHRSDGSLFTGSDTYIPYTGEDINVYSAIFAENMFMQDYSTYQDTVAELGSYLITTMIRTFATVFGTSSSSSSSPVSPSPSPSTFSLLQHYYQHLYLPLSILKLRQARAVPWTGILRSIMPGSMLHARAYAVSGGFSSSLYACQGSEGINAGLDRLSTLKYIAEIENEQYKVYQDLLEQYRRGTLSTTTEPFLEASSVGRRTRSNRRQATRAPLPPESHLQNNVRIDLDHTEILRILLQ